METYSSTPYDPLEFAERLSDLPPVRNARLRARANGIFSTLENQRLFVADCIASWEEEGRISPLTEETRRGLIETYLDERRLMERRFLYQYQLGLIYGAFLIPVLIGIGMIYAVHRNRIWRNDVILSEIYHRARQARAESTFGPG